MLLGLWLLELCPPAALGEEESKVELIVLGIAQDGGFPHIGCQKECCRDAWTEPRLRRFVTCLGLVDHRNHRRWMFEASPDLPHQLRLLDTHSWSHQRGDDAKLLDGIFLTHAHIGHYTGLMYLGREALGAEQVPVYAMPRMAEFLRRNGPWSQLVRLKNIKVQSMKADVESSAGQQVQVTPILVPHRDEFSETVGFIIKGPQRSALFLPDIDKWERWDTSIEALILDVDIALVDGTFFDNAELPDRDMSEIPHPFIVESMRRFAQLPADQRTKIHFIHLNHSNPALDDSSAAAQQIRQNGFHVAERGQVFDL